MIPQSLNEIYRGIIQLLYPLHCIHCGTHIAHTPLPLCPICMENIERVPPIDAYKHVAPLYQGSVHLDTVYAHWYFDNMGVVQKIHRRVKYGNRPHYAIVLGTLIGEELNRNPPFSHPPDLIVPVPLHQKRFLERGYNQSCMLAEGLARTTKIPLEVNALTRSRETRSQTGLSKQERQENVHAAFSVPVASIFRDKHILLVDDVLTTGATLYSAAVTLHQSGASVISIATFAFTRP